MAQHPKVLVVDDEIWRPMDPATWRAGASPVKPSGAPSRIPAAATTSSG